MSVLEDAISTMSASSSVGEERPDLDRFYTPSLLADELVNLATVHPSSVVDFAAGTGNLLAAALKKWPNALLYANDVDADAIKQAGERLPLAEARSADFLSSRFHVHNTGEAQGWSIILLNPPFSQREAPVHVPLGRHSGLRCSRSMAFVMTAVQYLSAGGQLLAILPSSTLLNKIDQTAREVLQSTYSVEVVREPAYGLFEGADVSTYFLRISESDRPAFPSVTRKADLQSWKIIRGSISIARAHRRNAGTRGWVHTTGLNQGGISHRYEFPGQAYGKIAPSGSILLPRVGRFGSDKIVLVERDDGEHLSDCILAIQHSALDPAVIADLLKSNFSQLQTFYGGTGAPYITRDRLYAFLAEML
ncbi:methyltransferase [Rhizobium leguminosarum]|nr:methyltransferase [Rhizobium leguminosarum]